MNHAKETVTLTRCSLQVRPLHREMNPLYGTIRTVPANPIGVKGSPQVQKAHCLLTMMAMLVLSEMAPMETTMV